MSLPIRKSPRIPKYDYSSENYYFITICTHNKNCIFGLPENRTALGDLTQNHILKIETHYTGVIVDKFVVMPNHVHMIVVLKHGQRASINHIIGQFKSGVTREARRKNPGLLIWQRSFHDHIIRNQSSYEKIWLYIENNPIEWKEDCFYQQNSNQ